jgi:short-subunit dehydrogenase
MEINGKVVLITGASSGIGAAAARRLAKDGACLALAARRKPILDQLAGEIEAAGGQALAIPADVTDRESIRRMVACTLERYGCLDVLINNAGLGFEDDLIDVDPDELRQQVNVNLVGVMECAQAALEPMLAQKSGTIVNVASMLGLFALPGTSVYSATKFGVMGFSEALRREVRREGVHVTAICPGFVATAFSPEILQIQERGLLTKVFLSTIRAETVADRIARAIRRPRAVVRMPLSMSVLVELGRIFAPIADRVVEGALSSPRRGIGI